MGKVLLQDLGQSLLPLSFWHPLQADTAVSASYHKVLFSKLQASPRSCCGAAQSYFTVCVQVLLFYPDGKKSSSTEGHLAPPGLPAPGVGNGGGNQGGGQGQVLHLPIPPGPIPGNANGNSDALRDIHSLPWRRQPLCASVERVVCPHACQFPAETHCPIWLAKMTSFHIGTAHTVHVLFAISAVEACSLLLPIDKAFIHVHWTLALAVMLTTAWY